MEGYLVKSQVKKKAQPVRTFTSETKGKPAHITYTKYSQSKHLLCSFNIMYQINATNLFLTVFCLLLFSA